MQQWLQFALTRQDVDISTGFSLSTTKLPACTILSVRASCKQASSSGDVTIDISLDGPGSIFGGNDPITIDVGTYSSLVSVLPTGTIVNDTVSDDTTVTFDFLDTGTDCWGVVVSMLVEWV